MKLFNELSVQFNLRKEKNSSIKHQVVYCRICCNKKRKNLSTGLLVSVSKWCKVTEAVKSKDLTAIEVNDQLALIRQKAINSYFDSKNNKIELTLEKILADVFPSTTNSIIENHTLDLTDTYQIAQQYIEDLVDKRAAEIISNGTYKSYKSAIIKFLKYVNMYYGTKKTSLASIDKQFIYNFENYLIVKEKLGKNYTHKVLSNTRKLFNYAYDIGVLDSKCSFKFKVRYTNPNRAIINFNELKELITLELPTVHLTEVRDCFLFQCFTGLAYAEIKGIRKTNIKSIDGENWITINRKKTGSESKLILLPIADKILAKYSTHPYCLKTSQLLPVKSNANYNNALKNVQKAAKLSTRLSSHIGRHIFATTVALQFGLPIETLAKVLGHTNLRTTMIYGKILDNKIQSDFAVLKSKLF